MKKFLLLLSILMLVSCAGNNSEIKRDDEVRSATEAILTFQDMPQEKALEYRWRSLRVYEDFIRVHKDFRSKLMADSMEQLADIYMEIEENTYLRYKKRFDHSKSRQIYEAILNAYPDRPENENILYHLARGYMEEGNRERSIIFLERITKEFPNGMYSHEANFRLGEYYFENNQMPKAIHYYKQVMKIDDFNLYDKSLYKLGWAHFITKDYEEAADRFMLLLDRKGVRLTPEGKEEIHNISIVERDLINDAIKTLVLVFEYIGEPARLANYFKVRGIQTFEPYVYRKLGDIYIESGRFREAADIYDAFVNTNPLHEDAPVFQYKIIEAYTKGNMIDLAYNARVKFVESYMEDSLWFKSNKRGAQKRVKELVDLNKTLVKSDMYQLAKYHYSNAHSTKKEKDYKEAILWIRRFIDIFPQEPESATLRNMLIETNFLLAEIYFELKDYDKAAEEYEKVAYKYQQSDYTGEASYRVLLALEKIARPGGKVRSDNTFALRFAESCKKFVDRFPKDKRVPEVLLNSAETYFMVGKFEEARAMAKPVTEHPLSSQKERYMAQRYIAESFLKEQVYNKSEDEIKKAIALIPESDKQDLPLLERALAGSLYKQAEDIKAKDKKFEAAEAYERVYKTVPNSDIAPVALLDAGVLFEDASQIGRAVNSYQVLVNKYPESRYSFDAANRWGELMEGYKDYTEAAKIYEKASAITPDEAKKEEMLFRSVQMYEKTGNQEGYNKQYKKFEETFPKSTKTIELTFKMASAKGAAKDLISEKELYDKVIALHKKLGASATIEATEFAAKAQVVLTDSKKASFEDLKLISPLEENLKKKQVLLKEALAGYTAAAKYRIGDVTTEAVYKMGEMLEHIKEAILNSEKPAELTTEQLEEYDIMLEEQASPFEEKAISTYEGNVRKTTEEGIYNEWSKKSYERLSKLLPARYKRVEAGERFTGDINSPVAEDPVVYNSRGLTYLDNGEFKKAETDFLKSLSIKHDFSDALLNLGILTELYLGKPAEALKNYKEYVKSGGKREDVAVWINVLEKRVGMKIGGSEQKQEGRSKK
ncbi:MAG: tetratricopeptide repeat protein [Nitrospirae bacterium]|nr:tetratricopeptide repeat protein [Nitrospirota bacterium]